MPDYRPIPATYEDEYQRFLRYAFEPETGPKPTDRAKQFLSVVL
ncbi:MULTISPECIES: hypothetical protein [Haladaptatus]|nr:MULTISPECIES: hypothetical protein [Haladaptatus]SHK05892.1 hypothetical protein SAMN05444342_0433 [Haladaptatus paucihalophilus DX253]